MKESQVFLIIEIYFAQTLTAHERNIMPHK